MFESEIVLDWLKTHGATILITLILAIVALYALNLISRHLKHRIQSLDDVEGSQLDKRTETIIRVIRTTGVVVIIGTALLIILEEFGVPILPLLASVGFVGLAFGLGAQTLVKDMINGMFILIEDQYTIGDAVDIGGVAGAVDSITLRRTIVRDLYGTIHHIPNGEIRVVANKSRDWSRAIIEIGITYEADVDKAINTLQQIGQVLLNDSIYAKSLMEEPVVTGIEGLDNSAVRLRLMAKTVPGVEWDVQRYLRREIRLVFAKEKIDIAFPTQEIRVVQAN